MHVTAVLVATYQNQQTYWCGRCAQTPTFVAISRLLSRALHRALAWVGWGLNRVALGRENVQSDMLYVDNLVRLPLESPLSLSLRSCFGVKLQRLGCV